MGLLINSKPQNFKDSKAARDYIKKHGIIQFINVYKRFQSRIDEDLKWGDEIEYQIVKFDHKNRKVRISLRAAEVLKEVDDYVHAQNLNIDVKPEYGSYMVEATPSMPYDQYANSLNSIEQNMRLRRQIISEALQDDESLMSIVCFPMLGRDDFFSPSETQGISHSSLSYSYPDECTSEFPRFHGLTENIRLRRGSKIDITVPLYMDKNTDINQIHDLLKRGNPVVTDSSLPNNRGIEVIEEPLDTNIHMDSMGYGMGLSCLQVTFQSYDVNESRSIYDQLVVIAPYMLAMTANSPIYRGVLSDIDTRWTVISQSVDDRTSEERNGPNILPKSRYDSVSLYISENAPPEYNDILAPIDQDTYNTLIQEGIDPVLARHIAHLFTRDALVTYDNYDQVDDEQSSEHFENIQSSNWQSVRWKPPTPAGPVHAWRVELRPMELQLTDFENAAFTVFSGLLERAILYYELNLYIPISLVDENMKRAHAVDAVNTKKFWFPTRIMYNNQKCSCFKNTECQKKMKELYDMGFTELSMNEIMGGNCWFPGFIPLIQVYLQVIGLEGDSLKRVHEYLEFLRQRANGIIPTGAMFIRNYVMSHPKYNHDSIINEDIAYDLMVHIDQINSGYYKDATHLPKNIQILPIYEVSSSSSTSSIASNNSSDSDNEKNQGPILVGKQDRGYLNCCKVFKMLQKARSIYQKGKLITPQQQ